MTPDADGSKAFYDGRRLEHPDDAWRGQATASSTPADAGWSVASCNLTADMTEHGARPCWVGYIGVDDVDARLAAVEAAGGKVLMPARDIEMAGRIAMVADPNGAALLPHDADAAAGRRGESHASSPPSSAIAPGMSDGRRRRPRWISIPACSAGRCRTEWIWATMGTYRFVAHDGVTTRRDHAQAAAGAGLGLGHYFRVADIDAASRGQAAGGRT